MKRSTFYAYNKEEQARLLNIGLGPGCDSEFCGNVCNSCLQCCCRCHCAWGCGCTCGECQSCLVATAGEEEAEVNCDCGEAGCQAKRPLSAARIGND